MDRKRVLLQQTAERVQQYLDAVDDRQVAATATADELRDMLSSPLSETGEDPSRVIELLSEAGLQGTVASQGPRYFGFVIGGSLPVTTAADWLVAGWDQNTAVYAMSPCIAVLEQVAGDWVRNLVGLPATWSVGYVTGGTMASFTGLAAARHHVLRDAGWDAEADGLFGAPPIEVVVSEESHYTISTSLRMLGLGDKRVRRVPTDGQGRMRPDALSRVLKDTTGPCVVCAQAGNVNTGAFDPLDAIADETAASGAWLHVDGAFGLWAAASPEFCHLVDGIERADSVTTDAHKWLNVPYDCGIALCAHPESHRRAMTLAVSYILDTDSERDPRAYTPEESRRARAVPVYAALKTLGRRGVAEIIDRCCRHARRFAERLSAAGYEVLNDVELNQVLVSFGDADTTHRVIKAIQEEGTCWCGPTDWKGRTAMRISVSSWATTEADVERSLDAMLRVAQAV